jgi:hypothetical protein
MQYFIRVLSVSYPNIICILSENSPCQLFYSMSQGKANFSMEFEKYMIAPNNVKEDVIKNASRKRGAASADDE